MPRKKKNLPPIKLLIQPSLLEKFKKKALRSRNEVFAVLIGTIVKENDAITEIRVEEIAYPPVEAGEAYVIWNPNDVIRFQALILPKQVVGTLHSHPESEPHISRQDIESSHELGEVVFGIFSWWIPQNCTVRKTSFDWYSGLRRMEVEIQ